MFSIPIKINASFLILIAFLSFFLSFNFVKIGIWLFIFIISLLIHELGHAYTAQFFGQKAEITLHMWGGTTLRRGPKLKLWQEFFIVLNGPLLEFLFLLGNYFLLHNLKIESSDSLIIYALNISIMINSLWLLFNLIPTLPLDGGHLLKILLQSIFGFKGYKASVILSFFLSTLLALLGFIFGQMIVAILLACLAFENYRAWTDITNMSEADQNEGYWDRIKTAKISLELGNYDKAWEILNLLKNDAQTGIIYTISIQMMANILQIQKKYEEAYQLIKPILNKITPDFTKNALQLAFNAGDYDKAIELGKTAYQLSPDSDVAAVNALSHASKLEVIPTLGWLNMVLEKNYPDLEVLLGRKEFDFLRENKDFQKIIKNFEEL